MMMLLLLVATLGLVSGTPWTKGWCDNKQLNHGLVSVPKLDHLLPQQGSVEPRHNLPTPEMVAREGYPVETHVVITEDGYILTLHRIPYGKTNHDDPSHPYPRPIVFLAPGLMCSSADWVMAIPEKGLGFILADAGYDVWMANFRGNTYSRNHITLDPDHQRSGFWDFTWDEMAHYDLPAMIEKALEVTGLEDLLYVGHSMGSTTMSALVHYRPDIASKIRLASHLSPTTYMSHAEGVLPWIATLDKILGTLLLDLLGVGEFLPSNLLMDCIISLFCHEGWITNGLCSNILFILVGFDEQQMNMTLLPTIMHHTPAGASSRTLLHYAQEINSGAFQGYDWGSDKKNIEHHGTASPPVYNLGDVITPTAIHWGDNDYLTASQDIIKFIMESHTIMPGMNHEVEYDMWNHLDFLWGIDANIYVYQKLLVDLETCTKEDCRTMIQ